MHGRPSDTIKRLNRKIIGHYTYYGISGNYEGLKKFYKLKNKKDLVGHLILGLAPHTSAGIIGRIIGFSKTQGCYAHPMWHSAVRRDCDGDECAIMLLMDCLINFSRKFLPSGFESFLK